MLKSLVLLSVAGGIMQTRNPFCHCVTFGPGHAFHLLTSRIHLGLLLGLHGIQCLLVAARLDKQLSVVRNWVLLSPVCQQPPVDVSGWVTRGSPEVQVVMVVSVAAPAHRLDVNQGGPTTVQSELPRYRGRCVEQPGIRTIDGPCRHPHGMALVTKCLDP